MDEIRLTQLLDALPLPVVLIDGEGRVVHMNPPARELAGGGVGQPYVSVLRQPAVLEAIEQALRGKRGEARHMRAGQGHETVYRVTAVPLAGGKTHVLASFEDVSHIEEAEQMRRDFVANVSHELRSPLTALVGFIDTLRGPARDDAVARDRFLDIMEREAGRMTRLVNDLMSLTRVEVNERVRPRERIDLVTVLENALSALRPSCAAAGVELVCRCMAERAMLPGDADQLAQVFHNLIENALKYAASGKRIEVVLHAPGHVVALRGPAVRVDVRDWGDGIDPLVVPRLTERFYRVDSHRSREMGGTGLGLAIVKHIVNRHRGRLQIESTPGEGSTFSVILPMGVEG